MTSVVYFISTVSDGPIKIGTTRQMDLRLKAVQAANHEELNLIVALPGSYKQEAMLHRAFCRDHIRGEWFRRTPELLRVIDGWAAHGFDHVQPFIEELSRDSWGINKKSPDGIERIREGKRTQRKTRVMEAAE